MEEDVLNALRSQAAYLPGGYDRDAHHLMVVPVPQELHPWTKAQLEACINFILSSLRDETKSNGFTVVMDSQKSSWRVTRTYLRYTATCLGVHLQDLLVIRPDTFKVVDNCVKTHKKGEPIILSKSRLVKYFDAADLPVCLGGNIAYEHDRWINNHIRFKEFNKLSERATNDLENLHLLLLDKKSVRADETEQALRTCSRLNGDVKASLEATLTNGNILITSVEEQHSCHDRISPDIIDLAQNIKDLLIDLESKQRNIALAWLDLEKSIQTSRELAILEEGVSFVTNWILGSAESLLYDHSKVGHDVATAEQLRKDHDGLEMQCLETYGFYAELLHKIQVLPIAKNSYTHSDLMSQKEFMDFVCRSFANRLEKRRNVLITSLRFYRLVSDYFDKTSEAFDCLILNNKAPELEKVPGLLDSVKDAQKNLENLETELIMEGEKLSDMLSMPVKDALGAEVQLDYSEDIINIRDIMDATFTRRNIFMDSLELQKLTLQQIIHIRSYEIDLATTIKWLKDLYKVLAKSHLYVGSQIVELQHQKTELQAFLDTSKEIYGYGCHLLEASFSLRQSSKVTLEPSEEYGANLKRCWKIIQDVSQEQLTRLRVCTVFHRSVDNYVCKLQELRQSVVASDVHEEVLKSQLNHRERLLVEVGRTVRLGRLLKSRLNEPLIIEDCQSTKGMSHAEDVILEPDNSTASDAISEKLTKVTQMAESLDSALSEVAMLYGRDRAVTGLPNLNNSYDNDDLTKSQSDESSVRCSSDQESAVTANPNSRSSSYHTASECRSSPWWDSEKNSDLEAEVDLSTNVFETCPAERSYTSTSCNGSNRSLSPTFLTATVGDHPYADDREETTSSTISQQSPTQSLVPEEEQLGRLSLGSDPPSEIIGSDDKVRPLHFIAWNRYYQSLINKQTIRSCL